MSNEQDEERILEAEEIRETVRIKMEEKDIYLHSNGGGWKPAPPIAMTILALNCRDQRESQAVQILQKLI